MAARDARRIATVAVVAGYVGLTAFWASAWLLAPTWTAAETFAVGALLAHLLASPLVALALTNPAIARQSPE